MNNGARLETYIIAGEPGSGPIDLNGSAARLAQVGDRVIVMAVDENDLEDWKPTVLIVDDHHQVKEILC